MPLDSEHKAPSFDRAVDPLRCPWCRCKLVRERRRMVDRLRSLFAPVKRYRCENFACQWQGNLSSRDTDGRSGDRAVYPPAGSKTDGRHRRMPVVFVAHMVLVAVGVVFVLVVGTMEDPLRIGAFESGIGSSFYLPAAEPPATHTAAR